MRYCVQPATAKDVATLALAVSDDDASDSEHDRIAREKSLDHLLNAFLSSTEVWAAHDRKGRPCALWGVGPASHDGEVGCFWLLTGEEVEAAPEDLAALSTMVLPEMLASYAQLESIVDAQDRRAVALLHGLGFTVEPAFFHEATSRLCHRVWIDADTSTLDVKVGPALPN